MPVERIIGRPVRPIASMNGRSTISNDATLNAATSSASSSCDRVEVERRREELDAAIAAVLGEQRLPVAGERDRLEQLVRGLRR